jgi:hypothetical protein
VVCSADYFPSEEGPSAGKKGPRSRFTSQIAL